MVVTSLDPLAPYKVYDDLILELANVTATVEDDSQGAASGTCRVEIVELLNWSCTNRREDICRHSQSPNDLR